MSNFSDFDFYRIGSWKSEGLFITVTEQSTKAAKAARQAITKIAVGVAFAAAGMASTVSTASVTVPTGIVVVGVPNAPAKSPIAKAVHDNIVDRDLTKITRDIDAELAGMLDFSSDSLDVDTLHLASQAVNASKVRVETDLEQWARTLVGTGV